MSYLPALILVVVGLLVLVAVLVRVWRHVRGFNQAADALRTNLGYETGTLRARLAAVQVAIRETRARARVKHAPAVVPSNSRGRQEEDRG
ncbi:bacteriophage holin [Actinophytocola sp.]|uniref:bacteriophage holin n=1 Tax=Actinophytocola sp. TaxID=1872138 RepID=UPI002D6E66DD|nr:bacteriophage holin [Actinophytocola sp.]HYQ64869.1 bacteriophage holin [Actinophytocola sp.]